MQILQALELKRQLSLILEVLSSVQAFAGIADQTSCLDAVRPSLFLIVMSLTCAHVSNSLSSFIESSSVQLLSKAGCFFLRAQLVRRELFRGESTICDIISVSLQSLLDHFADVAILLAKLGGDFGVMWMLHHAQKIMIDKNLQSRMYSRSDWMLRCCAGHECCNKLAHYASTRVDRCLRQSHCIVSIHPNNTCRGASKAPPGHILLTYVTSTDTMKEAARRLIAYVSWAACAQLHYLCKQILQLTSTLTKLVRYETLRHMSP